MPPVKSKKRRRMRSPSTGAASNNGKRQGWTFAEFMAQDFTGEQAREEMIWLDELYQELVAKERERCEDAAKEKKAVARS